MRPGMRIAASDLGWLGQARQVLERDGLVIFPTDTVYGLGCLIHSDRGIERLYQVKGRPERKAIPVLIGDPGHLARVSDRIPEAAERLIQRFWPGALTIVLPRRPTLPEALGPLATIGVRMPDHPVALQLLAAMGPMAVTSANLSGAQETRTAEAAWHELGAQVELTIDGGETPGGKPSTVVDLTQPDFPILRPGPVSYEAIHRALETTP
ncbi:MAG: L-threonylcarbamoyladenylate synthase [Anaerolineales bacterium]